MGQLALTNNVLFFHPLDTENILLSIKIILVTETIVSREVEMQEDTGQFALLTICQ